MSTPHDPQIASFLFEHARDILLVIDAESGAVVDANTAAEAAYGYPRDELLALTIFHIRAKDPDHVARQMRQANTEGILFETVHQRRDGSTFAVEVSSRGHTFDGRRMLLSVVRDISERKRLEAEREALIATTQRALALRDEFLVIASHELRSPVTNVSLQLQQLARTLGRDARQPWLETATQDSLAEISRLSALITTLLDAQAAAGHIVLALTVDLEPVRGRWDRLRLEQVFTNLLVNALKYGRGRPVHISGGLEGDHVRIDVHDEGLGIAREDIERVFGKFERAVPAAYGGLGLGLYIARQLIEAHGGSISAASTPQQGSTFQLVLPLE